MTDIEESPKSLVLVKSVSLVEGQDSR
jgi:hypothetical protein